MAFLSRERISCLGMSGKSRLCARGSDVGPRVRCSEGAQSTPKSWMWAWAWLRRLLAEPSRRPLVVERGHFGRGQSSMIGEGVAVAGREIVGCLGLRVDAGKAGLSAAVNRLSRCPDSIGLLRRRCCPCGESQRASPPGFWCFWRFWLFGLRWLRGREVVCITPSVGGMRATSAGGRGLQGGPRRE